MRAVFITTALLFFLLVAGCSTPETKEQVQTLQGNTMGTTYQVLWVDPADQAIEPAALQKQVDARLAEINAAMSTYDPTSEISRLNQQTEVSRVGISADFYQTLQISKRVFDQSGGYFDPTVGPLVDLWGFGPEGRILQRPTAAQVKQVMTQVGFDQIDLSVNNQVLKPDGVHLDLSAVAKGYGVDQVAGLLAAQGINNYFVEIGGEVQTRGLKPDGSKWIVGLEAPVVGEVSIESALALTDQALATSGNYRNFYEVDGQTFAHTINPLTGSPAKNRLLSVSVIADQCAVADAWATALMSMGEDKALKVAQDNQLTTQMLVADGDKIETRVTGKFEQYRYTVN
jgi:thiamine biosynthesis lipoprotein